MGLARQYPRTRELDGAVRHFERRKCVTGPACGIAGTEQFPNRRRRSKPRYGRSTAHHPRVARDARSSVWAGRGGAKTRPEKDNLAVQDAATGDHTHGLFRSRTPVTGPGDGHSAAAETTAELRPLKSSILFRNSFQTGNLPPRLAVPFSEPQVHS